MTKLSYGFVAGLLLLASCSNDEVVYEQLSDAGVGVKTFTSFTAALDEAADSRAYIVDGAEKGPKKVSWDLGDWIDIFSNAQETATEYTLQGVSDNEGTFVGEEVSGNKFYGIYAPIRWYKDADKVYFYVGEAIDKRYWDESMHANTLLDFEFYAPMLAISETNNLHFKQLTGMIHFTITEMGSISYAYLKGNNGEKIQGDFYVDLSNPDGGLQIDNSKEYAIQTKVYLDDEPLTNGDTMDVYFVVPPTVFENGFTLCVEGEDFRDNDVSFEKEFTDKLVVQAGEVKHFSMVNAEAELDKVREELDKDRAAKMKEQLDEYGNQTVAKALLALNQKMGGHSWDVYSGWGKDDTPVEDWEGLYFEDGKLVSIELSDRNLKGDLPAEIGDLKDLIEIDLEENQITSLPDELSNLTNLIYLDLEENALTGELPAVIAGMPNLEYLYLAHNNLEGTIPDSWLNNLSNLIRFSIGSNRMSGTITKAQQQSPMWQSLLANSYSDWRGFGHQQDGYGITIECAITEIQLPKTVYRLAVGDTVQLEINILPEGNLSDLNIHIYDDDVISIDENGKITALSAGQTSVRFSANDGYDAAGTESCYVYVYDSSKETGANEDFEDDEEQGKW